MRRRVERVSPMQGSGRARSSQPPEAAVWNREIGFLARSLLIATLPHRAPATNQFTRVNGNYTLTLLAPQEIGLPYGTIPRLLAIWMTTEAVQTKSNRLYLGRSLAAFLDKLGMQRTGGSNGSITRIKEQLRRLASTTISCQWSGQQYEEETGFRLIQQRVWWWDASLSNEGAYVVLSSAFFEEVIAHPVPVDLSAVRALRQSPLGLDIYCWLTYRMSYLKRSTEIPWVVLQQQFGVGYPTSTTRGRLDFKRKFKQQLREVLLLYQQVRIQESTRGIILLPSPCHVEPE